jgi:hypothetical protein
MALRISIDAAALAKEFKEFAAEVERDIKAGVANLATITHAKVKEMAATELKSSREAFMNSLSFEEVTEGVWMVSVDAKALWVEEGIPSGFDMKPGLLKEGYPSKKGGKYRIVPFEHTKAPSQMTQPARDIVSKLRTELKKKKIPFKKVEYNADGSPRLGRIHSLNLPSQIPGKGNTKALKGVSIYQTLTKSGSVRRDILTFRTVTNGESSSGKWIHPGLEPKKFLDRAGDWALKEWEEKILPEILEKWK